MIEDIQTRAITIYNNNMKFLEETENNLFEKLKLFETGLEIGQIKERYILEYKSTYFDVYDTRTEEFMYKKDSNLYSEEITKNISFESKVNSFRTFYGIKYEDEIANKSKLLSMLSNSAFGNAPIIDYVNRNLPKKEELKDIFIYFIFGTGLGLHIPFIHKKIKARLYFIIEPSLELFRLSLFVTDYSELSKNTKLFFSISDNEKEFRLTFDNLYFRTHAYSHYIKFFPFIKNFEMYINIIQNRLVTQGHILYAYNRELLSLHRTYQYAKDNYYTINISDNQKLKVFKNKKVIILAAGPSLQKEINFVKDNQDKYIIVSILGVMPYLEKNGIIPDIVTQYDEQTVETMRLFDEIKDLNFFSNTLFLFSSHVCLKLIQSVPKERLFIFHALYEAKKGFQSLTAPSIGEITYALIQKLGASDISLLGIDMALDPDTGKSHYDGYDQGNSFIEGEKDSLSNSFSLKKNIFKIKGNFLKEIDTLPIYKASIDHIDLFTKRYKNYGPTTIYNLSNGAYFEDTIPLSTEKIDTSSFLVINKKILKKELLDNFNLISTNDFSDEDVEYNNEKLNDCIKLREKFDSFYLGKKYPNTSSFRAVLHDIQVELGNSEYVCSDLQRIILNYCNNNFTYVFYLINLKNIDNPKKHIKQLYKILHTQINRIIHEYMSYIDIKKG